LRSKPAAKRVKKSVKAAARPQAGFVAWTLGTWFGSGLSPWAPGTAGTAASLPLVALLGLGLPALGGWNPWCLAVTLALFIPSVWAASAVEAELGRHDPGAVVVDETLGTLLTCAFVPASAFHSPWLYVTAFFLFRLLDIWKPGVIGQSQALPRGWGIVVDDVLAGLAGGAILGLAWHFMLRA
jgi:phosphatidylglycerophosphatase A